MSTRLPIWAKPGLSNVTPIKTIMNVRTSTVSCWFSQASQLPSELRGEGERPGAEGGKVSIFIRNASDWSPVLRLSDGGGQDRFLAGVTPSKFRDRTTFPHHTNAITDPKNLG